jgi:hypothetical protein
MAFKDRGDDLNALKQVYGNQVVDVVLAERAKKMKKTWQDIARDHGRNDIEGFKRLKL